MATDSISVSVGNSSTALVVKHSPAFVFNQTFIAPAESPPNEEIHSLSETVEVLGHPSMTGQSQKPFPSHVQPAFGPSPASPGVHSGQGLLGQFQKPSGLQLHVLHWKGASAIFQSPAVHSGHGSCGQVHVRVPEHVQVW